MSTYKLRYTGEKIDELLDKVDDKQDAIDDLDVIRRGADKGDTSVQGILVNNKHLTPDGKGNISLPNIPAEVDIANMGFTKNNGTVTGVMVNGESKSPNSAGVVDLGSIEGGGGVVEMPIYVAEFTVEELIQAMMRKGVLSYDMSNLIAATEANKLILIRQWRDDSAPGVCVMNCTYDGELYFSVVDTDGRVLVGGGSPEGINGYSIYYKEEIYRADFTMQDIMAIVDGATQDISLSIIDAINVGKVVRIPIIDGGDTSVVVLSATGYISQPNAGLKMEFIYDNTLYFIDFDSSINEDDTITLSPEDIMSRFLVDEAAVQNIVDVAIADAITTTLNTPV